MSDCGRRSNTAIITKNCNLSGAENSGIVEIFLQRKLLKHTKVKKEPEGQINFLRSTNVRQGQKAK